MTAQPTQQERERAVEVCAALGLGHCAPGKCEECDREREIIAQALADARAEGMMTGQRQGLAQAKVIAERLHDELNEKMADPEANRGALLDQQLGVILVMEALSSETAMDRTCGTCPLCRGSGNLLTLSRGLEYWPCSCCGGAGVTALYSPPLIGKRRRHGTGKGGEDADE